MNGIKNHYDQLYETSLEKINKDGCQTDDLIFSENDKRYGITVLIRPSEEVKYKVQKFLKELSSIDDLQYYYKNSDIHITVMSVISCYSGFHLSDINLEDYISLIKQCLPKHPFKISFKGITLSPSCVLIQGFFADETLNNFRDDLRLAFKNSNLEQSLDKRYAIQTAHSTVVRFQYPLKNKSAYLHHLQLYRNFNFGSFTINEVELVFNDWYQKASKVKKLHTFYL
ncbi:2'-5' RNA ligase family protein [Zhouia sp. PK063]|uniref:2'-5' RNA ligase family protein n=1 Tax=Zhouia sp. PK063 TaxID=3373602 RepID=UPI00378EB036